MFYTQDKENLKLRSGASYAEDSGSKLSRGRPKEDTIMEKRTKSRQVVTDGGAHSEDRSQTLH